MSDSRLNLPDFAKPPLIEVALSVQFEPLVKFRTQHLGLLWLEFRERFPKVEEHPPINSVIEQFGLPIRTEPSVQFQLTEEPPLPRCWFLNEPGTELIQVQQDRFVRNWRKIGEGDEYPRYEKVREGFRADLAKFSDFLAREGLGDLTPNQCEVTYVDHIEASESWRRHGQVGEVITVWSSQYSDHFLAEPEDVRFDVRYVIPDREGKPLGRLHIELRPAYRKKDNKPILILNFVARGRPEGQGLDGVLRFLDIGREWVVRGFASITTRQMHEIWGKVQ